MRAARDAGLPYDLTGHVAIVTGANHGIGASTAIALAGCGASVLASFLRTSDSDDLPETYRRNRAADATAVVEAIERNGGRAASYEADLKDDDAPRRVFECAEKQLGPVDILVNNASGWVSDTFAGGERHAIAGVRMTAVSAATFDQVSAWMRGAGRS